MLLSDKEMLECREKKCIVIEPCDERNVGTSSYDITLGENYFREQQPSPFMLNISNPWSESDTKRRWGKPHKARLAREHFRGEEGAEIIRKHDLRPDDKIIILEPGELILAHTNEFIGGVGDITTAMQARSGVGRNGIEICKCAGWGDVGFYNRWTMEITNGSRYYSVPLTIGRRLGQIVFMETTPTRGNYAKGGKYQTTQDIKELQKNWEPEMMLSQLYKDREVADRRK